MKSFITRPYAYAVTFSVALTLLLVCSLLAVFVIPRKLEQPEDEFGTIDFSRFTEQITDAATDEPIYILTLPSEDGDTPEEPSDTGTETDTECLEGGNRLLRVTLLYTR